MCEMRGKIEECGRRGESNLRFWRIEIGGSLFGSLRIVYLGEFLSIIFRDVKEYMWVLFNFLKERKNLEKFIIFLVLGFFIWVNVIVYILCNWLANVLNDWDGGR